MPDLAGGIRGRRGPGSPVPPEETERIANEQDSSPDDTTGLTLRERIRDIFEGINSLVEDVVAAATESAASQAEAGSRIDTDAVFRIGAPR